MRESVVERYLVARVLAMGGRCIKLSAPADRGWPDRLILLPGGVVAFAELKAPGRVATPLQLKRLSVLANLGFATAVLDSRTNVDGFLEGLARAAL